MPRRPRAAAGGYVYHVLNRAVRQSTLFKKPGDYQAFENVLTETCQRFSSVGLLAYCIMPNHWHLLLRPSKTGQLSEFMRWLTVTHTQRYHAHYHTSGTGPLYQGRFKSFPVQTETYFVAAARYVEANALRADLVVKAQDWQWSSLHVRRHDRQPLAGSLQPWPIPGGVPSDWVRRINRSQRDQDLEALRTSVRRGRPLGNAAWTTRTATALDLESTLRPRGRPRRTE